MSMKLSRRDRVIILILIVAVVIGLGTWLMLKPRYETMQESAARLASKETEKQTLQDKIDSLPDKKATLAKKVDDVLEKQKSFLSEKEYQDEKTKEIIPAYSENYQIDNFLKDLLKDTDIEITGIEANPLAPQALANYFYEYDALAYGMKINADLAKELPQEVYDNYNKTRPQNPKGIELGYTLAKVNYTCDNFESVYDAIDIVADCEKNIYLETCEADLSIEENADATVEAKVEGELLIRIYTLYPLDKNDLEK